MGHHLLLAGALRGALLFGAALLAMPLLRRAASSTRRLVLALALASALGIPFLSAALPVWHVDAPSFVVPMRGKLVEEPAVAGPAIPPATRSTSAVASSPAIHPAAFLGWVWALGALLLVARLAASVVRAGAVARRASPARGWERARSRAERATGVHVEVRETSELDAPAVCGVFAPRVLVPLAAAGWDDERRHRVLLHEMAHVRRRDGLLQILAELAVALHWIDPLAWLCARRLRIERELAADDAVLRHGARASSYAEDLLAVSGARLAPAGTLGMGEPARLVARVRAVLAEDRLRAPLGPWTTGALVIAASSVALALACTTPTGAASGSPASASAPALAAGPAGASIDPAIQAIADEELDRTLGEFAAPAGAIVVIAPSTGRILADAGRDRGARVDVARLRAYPPGSTLKVVTLAAALETGLASPTDAIDCEQGSFRYAGKTIEDWRPNGVLPLPDVLAVSSNIGFVKLFERIGGERLLHELRALHFGEAPGWVPDRLDDHSMAGALATVGEGVTATPLQIAAAYAALAGGGSYVEPSFSTAAPSARRQQVMKPETAHEVVAMLDEVVNGENGTGTRARVDGVRVAGKTGTAAWDLPGGGEGRYASFVGLAPEDAPRWVVLVGIEQPKGDAGGGEVAAPAFARVVSRLMGR